MSDEERFDGILYTMVQQHGGYEGFFDTVFGFLRRKTDFFTDFKKAEQVIAGAGKKHIEQYAKDRQSQETKTKPATPQPQTEKKGPVPQAPQPPREPAPKPEEKKIPETAPEIKTGDSDQKKDGEKLAPGIGNGSKTDKYIWTQKLEDLEVRIPCDPNLKKKDLKIKLDVTKCYIGTNDGKIVYIDGEWCDKIHPDDSEWYLEESDGMKHIVLELTKWRNTQNWWNCLVKGEPEIDTQKINPESSKLSDLDGEMKSTVEKMMFDMRQKQSGLPTSDELLKQEKLKEFMKAHPEMDFSKAKFA